MRLKNLMQAGEQKHNSSEQRPKLEQLSLTVLGSRLDNFLLTHQYVVCPAGQIANVIQCTFLWLLELGLG